MSIRAFRPWGGGKVAPNTPRNTGHRPGEVGAVVDSVLSDGMVEDRLDATGIDRRTFLKYCATLAGVLALPPQARVPLGEPKGLLKRAVGSRLPREILERPKKGFSAPWDVWMRTLGAKVRSEVSQGAAVQSGLLRPDAVDALGATATGAHLWSLLVLEHWVRRGS